MAKEEKERQRHREGRKGGERERERGRDGDREKGRERNFFFPFEFRSFTLVGFDFPPLPALLSDIKVFN